MRHPTKTNSGPDRYGFAEIGIEGWLGHYIDYTLCLCTDPAVVLCWGVPPPENARAAVLIPKDAALAEGEEAIKKWASSEPRDDELRLLVYRIPVIRFDFDALSWIGWFLSRAEEYESFSADSYGRFPREAALAEKLGVAEVPVVDFLVMRIRRALELVALAAGFQTHRRSPWPAQKRFALCLTHDVDWAMRRSVKVSAQSAVFAALQALRGRFGQGKIHLSEAVGLLCGGKRNAFWSFPAMAAAEHERGFRSAFYLLPHERDVDNNHKIVLRYDLARTEIREPFREFARQGWEIGLHTSTMAHEKPDGIAADWNRLKALLGSDVHVSGARSHHLCFRTPETWQRLAQAGVQYNSTLGWSESPTYRAGTTWPFRPFDRFENSPVQIWELGLQGLDAAPRSVEEMLDATRRVIDQTAQTGGCASLVSHPHTPRQMGISMEQFLQGYNSVLDMVRSRDDAWVATPRQIIERMEQYSQGRDT